MEVDNTVTQQRAVILDRDGTLIKECHYLSDPEQVELLPNAVTGLRALSDHGFKLVVVTNQSAVGRGYFNLERLASIHQRLESLLEQEAIVLDGIYFCPHIPADACECRKPRTGMLIQAMSDLNLSLSESFMVGDKQCDIEAGQRVGASTCLVRTGYGVKTELELQKLGMQPDYVANNLMQVATFCLAE